MSMMTTTATLSTLEIDRRRLELLPGETILQTARRHGIEIPALCDHAALEPFGACRVCLVEIWQPGWSRTEPGKLVTACLFPSQPGLLVATNNGRVRQARGITFELLLARAPRSQALADLASRWGVARTRFRPTERADDCILCGRCTRICEQLGHTAITTVQRGISKEVAPPLRQPPLSCVGCGACARICPTSTITMLETTATRTIWGRTFELVACEQCGRRHLTREQIQFFSSRTGLDQSYFRLCEECSRQQTATRMAQQIWPGLEGQA